MAVRTFQSRLAAKHGLMKRKILDNQIGLAGNPTDAIRVRYKDNREGDHTNIIIHAADVVPIIFPEMKDVPYRKVSDDGSGHYKITSLVEATNGENNAEQYKISFPHSADINVGDVIIRVFVDPDTSEPIVLYLKVTELLGTFGQLMLENSSAICGLEMEDLPEKVTQVVSEIAKRRLFLGW